MLGMEQMYRMALDPRIFPNSRLLAIMQGKDQSLPMAVAMAAKQQRDKLEQAKQGQTAQQGAKQPTVKDQMLARDLPPESTGLAALPAENMQGMDEEKMMAGGGIIAFKDEGLVPNTDNVPMTTQQMNDLLYGRGIARTPEQIAQVEKERSSFFTSPRTRAAMASQTATPTPVAGPDVDTQAGGFYGGAAPTPTQFLAAHPNITNAAVGTAAAPAPANQPTPGVGAPPATKPAAQDQGIAAITKRPDRFAGLEESQEAFDKKIESEKNAATGEFLMNLGFKMASTVGPIGKAIGEGGIAGLPGLTASRKTINELEKNRKDYKFNMAKAQAALDQGDDELAFKYKQLAEQAVYHSGLVTADMIKARAYEAGVGTKSDIKEQRENEAIIKAATDIHNKNMADLRFSSKFAKMSPAEQQQYFAGLRQQASQLAGKNEPGSNVAGTGYSISDIDAAIARKEKSSKS